jgi:hypothetical protein
MLHKRLRIWQHCSSPRSTRTNLCSLSSPSRATSRSSTMTFPSARSHKGSELPSTRNEKGGERDSIGEATVSVDQILAQAESTFAKFEKGDGTDHISEAIVLDCQALDRCPPGHRQRWSSLTRLSIHIWGRYSHLGAIEDIEEAVIYSSLREALELCPEGYPNRSTSLNNVALYLSSRHDRLGDMMDLHEAIILGRQALDLRTSGHPDRSTSLFSIGSCLSTRYEQHEDLTDLNEAIIFARQALDLCPPGHPDLSRSLRKLAHCLRVRFTQSRELKGKEDLFSLCTELSNISQTLSPNDLSAAKE